LKVAILPPLHNNQIENSSNQSYLSFLLSTKRLKRDTAGISKGWIYFSPEKDFFKPKKVCSFKKE
jgi:hypothetical protein